MRLKDKVTMITGSGSGIGRGTALLFAREGAKVVVCDVIELQVSSASDESSFINAAQ